MGGEDSGKSTSEEGRDVKVPEKLTGASMIGYLAEKNGLARKDVKQVMEDLFEVVGTGVMRGERVALGKIGKMFIRVRPARGARTGTQPAHRAGDHHPGQARDQGAPFHLQQDLQGGRAEGEGEEVGSRRSVRRHSSPRGPLRGAGEASLTSPVLSRTSSPPPSGPSPQGRRSASSSGRTQRISSCSRSDGRPFDTAPRDRPAAPG